MSTSPEPDPRASRRPGSGRQVAAQREGPRREARERALSLLYEACLKRLSVAEVIASLAAQPDPFVLRLVLGVEANQERIDELITGAAVGWELERMPVIDRSLLRLATFELLEDPETPVAVVLDEAVDLAKRFSTEQSGGFVNGVLSTIARAVRR